LKHHQISNFSCVAKIANDANSFLLLYHVLEPNLVANSLMDAYHFSYKITIEMSNLAAQGKNLHFGKILQKLF
jgi:hypothetical protein